jgi:hypothetical protein
MFRSRRFAVLAAVCAATAVIGVAPASASAETVFTLPFSNWAVWGSLTVKKLNEPVVLPKGSSFTGGVHFSEFGSSGVTGTVFGHITVPPFKANLKLAGLVPISVSVRFTQVGEAEGSVITVPSSNCRNARFNGFCVNMGVTTKAIIGIAGAGIAGIELPTSCETAEPVSLSLNTTSTLNELTGLGAHFKGTTTIPPVKCGGIEGIVEGIAVTALMSGPENPYAINLAINEPAVPSAETLAANQVSQISARLNGEVNPNGEPETDCHFEYGTSTSYTASVPCVPRPGRGFSALAPVTGLKEATTYHYRVVSSNPLGTTDGGDVTFTTLGRAGAPEWGHCVGQSGGEYTDTTCSSKSKRPGRGKFAWQPGPAPTCVPQKKGAYADAACTTKTKPNKGHFEKQAGPKNTSTVGALTLETPGLGGDVVTCTGGSGAGEITGAQTGTERLTLTGCEEAANKCTSEGANATPSHEAGAVETNLLAGHLLGPVASDPWVELTSSEHEPYLAEFACGASTFRVKGSIAGVREGDVRHASQASTTSFFTEVGPAPEGEQALETEVSSDGGKSWSAPNVSSAVFVLTNSAELATEIKP